MIGTQNTNNIEDIYPLSPMQAGMLFHTLLDPESGVYCEQTNFELHGELNIAAFTQAWQQVISRYPILRTAYVWDNLEKPIQVVGKQVKFPWQEEDWRGIEPREQQQKLATLLAADRQQGFNLAQAPLMRLILIRMNEQVYNFTWSHHHISLDGWSAQIIFKEVISYYKAFCQNQNIYLESPAPYRNYIAWLQQQNLSQAEIFWRNLLKGFTVPTQIGIKSTNQLSSDNGEQKIKLSPEITSALQSLAQQHQLTLNTLVQGAWALLLSHYSGEKDIIFGATVSGRPPSLPKAQEMVGLFINTLPVRVKIDPEQYLLPWLQQLFAQQVEARQYEYTPLTDIQKWSDIPAGSPLFETIVVFENYPLEAALKDPGIKTEIKNQHTFARTNYPLTLIAAPGQELLLKIAYQQSDRPHYTTITRILGHLQTLLTAIATNPHQQIKNIPLLTAKERNQLLREWNQTETNYPQQHCLHQLLEAQVEKTPDAVAVEFQQQSLTYRELNTRANQLANHLQTLGAKPEVTVGICLERSLQQIIALVAILKAGSAYLPLDPSYPPERLQFMVENAQASILLTESHLLETLPTQNIHCICLDNHQQTIPKSSIANLCSGVTPNHLAYVIYTSGSTGQPKGVAMPHLALVNLINWQLEHTTINSSGKTLQFAPISFDVSCQEVFSTLAAGGTLVLVTEEIRRDPQSLLNYIQQTGVERLFLPCVALNQISEVSQTQGITPSNLREVIVAGEQLRITPSISNWFQQLQNCTLHNQYGPSETHVVTAFHLTDSPENWPELPAIGTPIANTQIYLLNSELQPVPIGVPGELYVGGISLARGYLNRPDLTTQKFIPHPFSSQPGHRLYKTGDLARYLADGQIEFLGRTDDQIKIRGFRIEMGEIEAAINQHPDINKVVVTVQENSQDDKRLIAYLVLQATDTSTLEIRNFLKTKLPNYMIPSAFVVLEEIPLTPNGKIDRRALPAPDPTNTNIDQSFVSPRNSLEEQLGNIWSEVLKIEKVGIHDHFFELGGHSLLVTQLVSRIRDNLEVEIAIQDIFVNPTVAELSIFIAQQIAEQMDEETLALSLAELEALSEEDIQLTVDS